jgi:AcrR family transcriptional regulator
MSEKQYHHGDLRNSLIQAGIEILAEEGVSALSVRQAATRAGVSHSAPYAHFHDKQDLIAAISTEGFRRLHARITSAAPENPGDIANRLTETAWAYVQFALENRALFNLMFSGILEDGGDYPDFAAISQETFLLIVDLVRRCQQAGLLRRGPADVQALSIWSLVHGFVSLLLEQQISHTILERGPLKELLAQTLGQIMQVRVENRE